MTRLSFLCALLAVGCVTRQVGVDESDSGYTAKDAGARDGGGRDGGTRCSPPCNSTSTCVDGQCVLVTCGEGETRCGAVCSNLNTDKAHCGTCAKSCPNSTAGETVCLNGQCGLHCPDDPDDMLCASPGHCTTGHCCPPSQMWCGDHCVNPSNDLDNCGTCGHQCPPTTNGSSYCSSGQCGTTCSDSYRLCNGACVDLQTDQNNCGFCARTCPSGCAGGNCILFSTTCTIASTSGWQSCGQEVAAGQMLSVTASGYWTATPTWESRQPPEGTPNNADLLDYRYDLSCDWDTLLWHVGSSATQCYGAGGFDGTAPSTGILEFRINDKDGYLSNNSGSVSVTVAVSSP